ncbi:MAG: 3,4-dihydroxy-2-butanone-4-phosphate synthase [Gammaproteobacteria bacterium]|nr:MAG: 3,4-dihydroxy-2-butanone-4-phosphate synthase [Gammaproteobacteria bacterium]
MQSYIEKVESALGDLRKGKMIILTDHPDRENEGDLICAAEMITPDIINFMIRNGSGIVCLSLATDQVKKLGLNPMVSPYENTSHRGTPFTVSIEAKVGVTTGVSAQDRATTILAAINDNATQEDLAKPGHVFPLHAKAGGVLERQGHTEGSIDMVRLAGFKPAAVLCEIMNADGTMAKGEQLYQFAKEHHLKLLSIDDTIAYRHVKENLIAEEVTTNLPLEKYGMFDLAVIREKFNGSEHVILTAHHTLLSPPLVRIHSACMTGDLFGSKRCDCYMQLHYSLQRISKEGGILIYLNQEGRGVGLFNKIKAYHLQENGLDTVEANHRLGLPIDSREYYLAANILRNRNIQSICLLTNNPHKVANLKKYGIDVQTESMPIFYNECNKYYLQTKKEKLNHSINF